MTKYVTNHNWPITELHTILATLSQLFLEQRLWRKKKNSAFSIKGYPVIKLYDDYVMGFNQQPKKFDVSREWQTPFPGIIQH